MKYRILSSKELEPLKDDFIRFLSANTVTGEDWAKIKSNKPNEALKLIEIFSVLEFLYSTSWGVSKVHDIFVF